MKVNIQRSSLYALQWLAEGLSGFYLKMILIRRVIPALRGIHLLISNINHLWFVFLSKWLMLSKPSCAWCFQILIDAHSIRLGNIPVGSAVDPLEGAPAGTTYKKQTVYELCSCANGKLYLSPAEKGSTCQTTSNFCLWSWKSEMDGWPRTHGLHGVWSWC